MKSTFEVLIIGGGTAGIMVASQLRKKKPGLTIAIVDPATTHYYQPAWTLVGAGAYDFEKTARPMKDLIPDGVEWIKEKAVKLMPEQNKVQTETLEISYDYLVVATGIIVDPTMIDGLQEAMDMGVACSNYTDPKHTWEVLQNFKGGNALFTQPATKIKCGGAPQKIMYLAADYFRKNNLADKTNVIFATPGTVIFGVKEIRATLEKVLERYNVMFNPHHTPEHVDAKDKYVTFKVEVSKLEDGCLINEDEEEIGFVEASGTHVKVPFDMLHLAPPQRAPKLVSDSPLADEHGWVAVNKHTMQSNKFDNVFGLGDSANLPTAKTGAAVRKQAPIVVENIAKLIDHNHITNLAYNGYSSCPLVTGYGKMVLAEFDYDQNFIPDPKLKQMFVNDSSKEHYRLWLLKKYGLPYLYWNKMMKGIKV